MAPPRTFISLGDPVMDVIAHVDSLPPSIPEPGGCLPIDAPGMQRLLSSLDETSPSSSTKRSPGGSACNVARGVAELLARLNPSSSVAVSPSEENGSGSIRVQFLGMAGDDETAAEYEAALSRTGVAPRLLRAGGTGGGGGGGVGGGEEEASSLPTATCLCLVTPGGQRTMRTCLGAAALLRSERQLPRGWSEGAAAVHVEGYALWRDGLAAGAMAAARFENETSPSASSSSASSARVLTSLDCASFEVVRARRAELEALLRGGGVDVLFCNEEEAAALAEGEGGEGAFDDDAGAGDTSGSDDPSAVVSRALRRALDLGARVAVASLGPAGARAMVKKKKRAERESRGEGKDDPSSSRFASCCYSCPAEAVESVADTVGAGDAFAAGFLSSLLLSSSSDSSSSKSSGGGDNGGGEEEGEEEEGLYFLRGDVVEAALRLGCAAGAAAVRASGADPGKEAWDSVAAKAKRAKEKERARELVRA